MLTLKFSKRLTRIAAVIAIVGFGVTGAFAQMAPFGSEHDVGFAGEIWAAMEKANLAGPNAIRSALTDGNNPHAPLLETFYTQVEIGGRVGALAVKRNYGPEGVEREQVINNPAAHLGAITVMFQREKGFDDENNNWFWVKFLPDGSIDKNGAGMALAGRVAKGMDQGCIACHQYAPGDDYMFTGTVPN